VRETLARPQLVRGTDAEADAETASSITSQRLFDVEGTRGDPFKNRGEPEQNRNAGSRKSYLPNN